MQEADNLHLLVVVLRAERSLKSTSVRSNSNRYSKLSHKVFDLEMLNLCHELSLNRKNELKKRRLPVIDVQLSLIVFPLSQIRLFLHNVHNSCWLRAFSNLHVHSSSTTALLPL